MIVTDSAAVRAAPPPPGVRSVPLPGLAGQVLACPDSASAWAEAGRAPCSSLQALAPSARLDTTHIFSGCNLVFMHCHLRHSEKNKGGRTMRTSRPRIRGVTLIELMISIAVTAITLAMATPSFVRLIANNRVDSASNSLINTFQYARNTALRSGQQVIVCPVASAGSTTCSSAWEADWSVISVPASASSILLASNKIGAGGVAVQGSAATSTPLVFSPRGLVTGLPSTGTEIFTFCDSRGASHAGSVMVNSVGYVQASPTPGADPDGNALACP